MDFVIGGAWQGKLAYAKETFQLAQEDIFYCTRQDMPDWSRRCVAGLEEYVLGCIQRGEAWQLRPRADAVLICRDIFCGVVPVEAPLRLWREETGRMAAEIARQADTVTRLFCGLAQRLK